MEFYRLSIWPSIKFVCLEFSSHSRIFHSFRDVTIAGEGLQILTYARHSWPLSTKDSLGWHIYCDTRHLFIMVISEDPWNSYILLSDYQLWISLPVLTTYVCHGWDSNTQPSACWANTLNHCTTVAVLQ